MAGDDSSSSDDETSEEQLASQEPPTKKRKTNSGKAVDASRNSTLLQQKIKDIALPADLPWDETLVLDTSKTVEEICDDPDDDLAREKAIYQLALEQTKIGLARLTKAGIPFRRPTDFYAVMVKSDKHMSRVKNRLLREKKAINIVEQRKERKAKRKLSKGKRIDVLQKRKESTRSVAKGLAAWKKLGGGKSAKTLEAALAGKQLTASQKLTKSWHRKQKDKKFGKGGKKGGKYKKGNDKRTVANIQEFKKNRKLYQPTANNRSAKKGKNRPGKNARQRKRAKQGGS